MKGVMVIVGSLTVLFLGLVIGGDATEQGDYLPDGSRSLAVIGADQIEMLESDRQMLEQMRVSTSPAMLGMIRDDPMWRDEGMICAQEAYQTQLDRMLGKRTHGR